ICYCYIYIYIYICYCYTYTYTHICCYCYIYVYVIVIYIYVVVVAPSPRPPLSPPRGAIPCPSFFQNGLEELQLIFFFCRKKLSFFFTCSNMFVKRGLISTNVVLPRNLMMARGNDGFFSFVFGGDIWGRGIFLQDQILKQLRRS